MPLYRHGDVIVKGIETLPEGAKKCGNITLAYGEMTGHSHRIADPNTAQTFECNGQLYLEVTSATALLIHEEHAAIKLAKGVYHVWQQREYTPSEIRRVYD